MILKNEAVPRLKLFQRIVTILYKVLLTYINALLLSGVYVQRWKTYWKGRLMKLITSALTGAFMLASTVAFAESHEAAPEDVMAMTIEAALAGGDAEAGAKIFKKCKACHMIGDGAKSRTGPPLTTIVGSQIGMFEGFKYSKGFIALSEEGAVWSIENLDTFFIKPKEFVAKTKMSFAGIKDEDDRANLIAYLATFATPAE